MYISYFICHFLQFVSEYPNWCADVPYPGFICVSLLTKDVSYLFICLLKHAGEMLILVFGQFVVAGLALLWTVSCDCEVCFIGL